MAHSTEYSVAFPELYENGMLKIPNGMEEMFILTCAEEDCLKQVMKEIMRNGYEYKVDGTLHILPEPENPPENIKLQEKSDKPQKVNKSQGSTSDQGESQVRSARCAFFCLMCVVATLFLAQLLLVITVIMI